MRKHLLKSILPLALIALMTILSSCNKETEINEAYLIGPWDIGQAAVDIKVGPVSLVQFLKTTLQLGDEEAQAYMNDLVAEYDYISGGTITFHLDYSYQMLKGDFVENGTWDLEGNKLYLTITGETLQDEHLLIEDLDETSAFMIMEEDLDVDLDEDGTSDFTATIIIEVDLTKQ